MVRRKFGRSPRILTALGDIWERATLPQRYDGATWYPRAHDQAVSLAAEYQAKPETAIGVIAAVSPSNPWDASNGRPGNLQDARTLLQAHTTGEPLPLVGTYGNRNVQKAREIMNGADPLAVLSGPKVRSFYANILDPTSSASVTIDRHAKCAALRIETDRDKYGMVSPAEYPWLSRHYQTVAAKIGVPVTVLQATVWVYWREYVLTVVPF